MTKEIKRYRGSYDGNFVATYDEVWYECEECGGTGWITCQWCEGEGEIEPGIPCEFCDDDSGGHEICPECGGEGVIIIFE